MNEDLLKNYASEMKISNLSLEKLIDSHRQLRSQATKSGIERSHDLEQARAHVTRLAMEDVKERGWFSLDRLRSMTLGELASIIQQD